MSRPRFPQLDRLQDYREDVFDEKDHPRRRKDYGRHRSTVDDAEGDLVEILEDLNAYVRD